MLPPVNQIPRKTPLSLPALGALRALPLFPVFQRWQIHWCPGVSVPPSQSAESLTGCVGHSHALSSAGVPLNTEGRPGDKTTAADAGGVSARALCPMRTIDEIDQALPAPGAIRRARPSASSSSCNLMAPSRSGCSAPGDTRRVYIGLPLILEDCEFPYHSRSESPPLFANLGFQLIAAD